MTKIKLGRLEQAIAELEAGKGVVPVLREELEALRKENAALKMQADRLAEALELADCSFCGAKMDMSVVEKKIRAALAEYQAHKEGS